MIRALISALAIMMTGVMPLDAADRQTLGWGRIFTNDFLGDGQDRWRSGSYTISLIRGTPWQGRAPARFGALVEYRFHSEIISPSNLTNPDPDDRRFVGVLGFGAHTHWTRGAYDLSAGVDFVFVGPQTQVDQLQEELHDLLGAPRPNISDFQVPDAVYPTARFEIAQQLKWTEHVRIRPFAELVAGAETFARIGVDATIGRIAERDLVLRDTVSGQLYTGISGSRPRGWSFVAGGDIAAVADSRYLATPGIAHEQTRYRLRLGAHRQWRAGAAFIGLTYLSPEFEGQNEGQLTGSINLRFPF